MNPVQLAKEFIAVVDGLKTIPGMMTTHDQGKEAICRELLRVAETAGNLVAAEQVYDDSEDESTDCQTLVRCEDAMREVVAELAAQLRGGK